MFRLWIITRFLLRERRRTFFLQIRFTKFCTFWPIIFIWSIDNYNILKWNFRCWILWWIFNRVVLVTHFLYLIRRVLTPVCLDYVFGVTVRICHKIYNDSKICIIIHVIQAIIFFNAVIVCMAWAHICKEFSRVLCHSMCCCGRFCKVAWTSVGVWFGVWGGSCEFMWVKLKCWDVWGITMRAKSVSVKMKI